MIRTALLVFLGWCAAAALLLVGWSRLPRPRLLRWGGVYQRRSPKFGVFVPGKTPAEAVDNLVKDSRFVPEKADV